LKLSVSSGSHPDNENANYQILNKPTAWWSFFLSAQQITTLSLFLTTGSLVLLRFTSILSFQWHFSTYQISFVTPPWRLHPISRQYQIISIQNLKQHACKFSLMSSHSVQTLWTQTLRTCLPSVMTPGNKIYYAIRGSAVQ
jgi:hypothetical protein